MAKNWYKHYLERRALNKQRELKTVQPKQEPVEETPLPPNLKMAEEVIKAALFSD